MVGSRTRLVLALTAALCWGGLAPRAAGQASAQKRPELALPDPSKLADEPAKKEAAPSAAKKFDPAVVSAGEAAFSRRCTQCHDAARALELTKDLPGWRATVQRMASRRGADIPAEDIEPIAVYLASRGVSDSAAAPGATAEPSSGETSSFSGFATLSPLWRGGNANADIQNPGFFPDVWVGGSWQGKVVSARVTACSACHGFNEDAGLLQRVELVEAVARADLSKWLDRCCSGLKGGIEAGRFIVPFGAFSAQVNPSLYRTVSKPVIFNMGQRVYDNDLGEPVLPLPYSDEGVNVNFELPLAELSTGSLTATLDAYLVNGLVGTDDGLEFYRSRDLLDNNRRPGGGGRLTLGGPNVRAGASITSGRFNEPGAPENAFLDGLAYHIYGFDVQARHGDLLRLQFEYARRRSERTRRPGGGDFMVFDEQVHGLYVEGEVRPWEHCCMSLLARYDWLGRRGLEPPQASALPTGDFTMQRFTWGVNFKLWRQSLLMLNHEIWYVPQPLEDLHVLGVRYAITF
jgi:mono/diheme cytochrome c family protein